MKKFDGKKILWVIIIIGLVIRFKPIVQGLTFAMLGTVMLGNWIGIIVFCGLVGLPLLGFLQIKTFSDGHYLCGPSHKFAIILVRTFSGPTVGFLL